MKIHCVGGGPAGLYFAAVVKIADPGHEITVFARSRSHDAGGSGVALSAGTCRGLARSDPEMYVRLRPELVGWDTIDVHARGERVRMAGHGFFGVGRNRLLRRLAERAESAGVRILFDLAVDDPEQLRDCDLLVGADGRASVCRRRWQDAFGTTHEVGDCRFIQLVTDKRFDGFMFSFRESVHGVFQVHAHPFSERMSSFVVECHEDTWRRAGLDRAGAAYTAAYCEELFADELDGHRLLGDGSRWTRFDTLRNERWHHENVVLLGDAAHTAHFSVCGGPRLALDGAAALARALREHRDTRAAIEAYERVRKPRVERMQAAADESRRWFESTDALSRLPARQLAFSVFTRTPCVTRRKLKARDDAYVAATERWFATRYGAAPWTPPHAVPVEVGGLSLAGRTVRTAHGTAVSPDAADLWIVPVRNVAELPAVERTAFLRSSGAKVAARIDATGSLTGVALVEAVRAAAASGFDALEMWMMPSADAGPQLDVLETVREAWRAHGPVIVRWDAPNGLALARRLARHVAALHVPARSAWSLRAETGLRVIATVPHDWTEDDRATALLSGRADLVDPSPE